MMNGEEQVVIGLVQDELGYLLGDSIWEHTTTIEFGVELVGIEEVQDGGQLVIIELGIGQVRVLLVDLHAGKDTMMEQEVS